MFRSAANGLLYEFQIPQSAAHGDDSDNGGDPA
jgi:hypothetical protein